MAFPFVAMHTAPHPSRDGVIAIIRSSQSVDLPRVNDALSRGGIRVQEITLNTPGALRAIDKIRQRRTNDGLLIGAGTVLCAEDVAAAVESGAQFIVTPTFNFDTIRACNHRGVPIICGCATPTEMFEANRAGADLIKLFPATRFGPAYVRSILQSMPCLQLVPTGGVSASNLVDYFDVGVAAVAIGSQLVSSRVLAESRWDELTASAAELVAAVSRARRTS